jgi:aspartyl-tRNA synthetase
MFKYLGFTEEEKRNSDFDGRISIWCATRRFSFGLDRLVAILGGQETIRDFIAFPKNNSGRDVMIDAPSIIDDAQLKELHIRLLNQYQCVI